MDKSKEKEPVARPVVARTPSEIQRLKLEKLMKNPDKQILIPEKPKERGAPIIPDFVRNVMGSSAGAGSGEFHVYRHLRRKEYARQHYMNEKARWEKMESEYHDKLEENKRKADDLTAKKRAKRQKKKLNRKKQKGNKNVKKESSSSSSSSEAESDSDDKQDVKNEEEETQKDEEHESNNDNQESTSSGKDNGDVDNEANSND